MTLKKQPVCEEFDQSDEIALQTGELLNFETSVVAVQINYSNNNIFDILSFGTCFASLVHKQNASSHP
jgi:hypothetical protein